MAGWRVRGALLLLALLALLGAGALVYETWYDDFSALSHYEALGVAANAPPRDIKRAFRERSLQYHPDKSAAGTTELFTKRFHRISDAYQVLSDAHSRSAYDQELAERARIRTLEQQRWRTKLTPTTRDWPSIVRFYATEFPVALASLALLVLDVRLLMMALVCLGCAIFATDVALRAMRVIGDAVFASQSTASRHANDAAMRAARLRQQQALDARCKNASLTQRRAQSVASS